MIYLLIPIYNEAGNLELLSTNLKKCLPRETKFFVFVNDGSSDNSTEIIKSLFNANEYILLGDGMNHGPGYCFNMGFEWILGHSHQNEDKIITIEADNTSDINIMEQMLTISNTGFDLVLASVYAQGGGFEKTTFLRKIISFSANLLFRFAYDIKVLTLSSFYRIYSIQLIKDIKDKYEVIIKQSGFISMIEILIKSIRLKSKIIEVPMILHSNKRMGKSKMKILKTSIQYISFLMKNKI